MSTRQIVLMSTPSNPDTAKQCGTLAPRLCPTRMTGMVRGCEDDVPTDFRLLRCENSVPIIRSSFACLGANALVSESSGTKEGASAGSREMNYAGSIENMTCANTQTRSSKSSQWPQNKSSFTHVNCSRRELRMTQSISGVASFSWWLPARSVPEAGRCIPCGVVCNKNKTELSANSGYRESYHT
jgi:hypothetical protein